MGDEVKNVTETVKDVSETVKDVAEKLPETITVVKNNPLALAGVFVGGAVTAIAGSKAFQGIKGYLEYRKAQKEAEKENKPEPEPEQENKEDQKQDKNQKK